MSLRWRSVVVLAGGAALFVLVTAGLRVWLVRGEVGLRDSVSARFVGESAGFELERTLRWLRRRLAAGVEETEALLDGVPVDEREDRAFWRALTGSAELGPFESLAVIDPEGRLRAADGWLDQGDLAALALQSGLTGRSGPPGVRAGLLTGGEEPLMGASVPVRASYVGHGPGADAVPGTEYRAVLVRRLDLASLEPRGLAVELELIDLARRSLPEDIAHVSPTLWRGEESHVEVTERGHVAGRACVDPRGRPSFLLLGRAGTNRGALVPAHLQEPLIWEALAAAVVVALALGFVQRRVLRPLEDLEGQARRLARTEHGTLSFHSAERGEVRDLADALDQMLCKMQADRREYVRSARIAGMSDVSMAVVHNAGNLLNSLNVSTQYVAKEIASLGVFDLRSLVDELEEHKTDLARYVVDDPNGRFMIPFLAATAEALEDLRTRCLAELGSVDHGIEHVMDLIRSQERYAIGASVVEETRVPDVVEMALNVAALSNELSGSIQVVRSYTKLPPLRIDRHKLTSILINVISNAIEALVHDDVEHKRLELSVYSMSQDRFVIEVTDTGVGIAPENLDRIFNSSFTTKPESFGQGLHTTANLCNELGIAIGAVSEGELRGTTIKLRVPYEPPGDRDDAGVEEPAAALPAEEPERLRLRADPMG